jgi:hypothetical protein
MKDYMFKTKRLESQSVEKKQIRKVSTRKNRRPNSMKILKTNIRKYNCDINMYSRKIVTDLMYDEKKHIVSVFKEYLILDDIAEFLER